MVMVTKIDIVVMIGTIAGGATMVGEGATNAAVIETTKTVNVLAARKD